MFKNTTGIYTFDTYEQLTNKTAIYQKSIDDYVDELEIPDDNKKADLKNLLGAIYEILGITGEAGELANKMKKVLRDNYGKLTEETMKNLSDENGDVTWYNARIFKRFKSSFQKGVESNIAKLINRAMSNTIKGSGDNR